MSKESKLSSPFIDQYDSKKLIVSLFQYALRNQFAIAMWRLPQSESIQLILDDKPASGNDNELERLDPGFIFSPFDNQEKNYHITAKLSLVVNSKEPNGLSEIKTSHAHSNLVNDFERKLESVEHEELDFYTSNSKVSQNDQYDQYDHYIKIVNNALKHINQGLFKKVVPARVKKVSIPQSLSALDIFDRLCQSNPNAFVSCVAIPDVGTWLGASPEILISTDQDQIFKTVSLAGTQAYNPEIPLHHVAWTQKEIEEQAMVSRYIINCFKAIRLREFDEEGPRTIRAGNLTHLKTDFTVDMNATNFLNLGSTMLHLLHPTSAVCGMPMQASREFLVKHENFNREFFSGYLGPVNYNWETHLYVNLRCLQLFKEFAVIYAGAGVTSYSIPEQEWEETESKFRTLLDVIE